MADTQPLRTCPRCASHFLENDVLEANALSRTSRGADQESVYICSWCGMQESIEDMATKLSPQSAWPVMHNITIYADANSYRSKV